MDDTIYDESGATAGAESKPYLCDKIRKFEAFEEWWENTPLTIVSEGYTRESLEWAWQAAMQHRDAEVQELVEALGYAGQVLPDAMAFIDRGLEKDAFNAISSVYGKSKQALENYKTKVGER